MGIRVRANLAEERKALLSNFEIQSKRDDAVLAEGRPLELMAEHMSTIPIGVRVSLKLHHIQDCGGQAIVTDIDSAIIYAAQVTLTLVHNASIGNATISSIGNSDVLPKLAQQLRVKFSNEFDLSEHSIFQS
jgi:hypothetical protein